MRVFLRRTITLAPKDLEKKNMMTRRYEETISNTTLISFLEQGNI